MEIDWQKTSILITGGTGSFGRKFVEVAQRDLKPARIIVFSRDELKQHEMRASGFDQPNLRYFIGDVRDRNRLVRAMHGVDIVIHAAALKQVPACEYNPIEAIRTNVEGAVNVIDAAIDSGVKKVIALSTDKAVNPVNLYGATKLCAEKLFIQSNAYGAGYGTRLACVRYGNVVGSRGSVIPVFLEQRKTGMVTVTDDRMTRFFLTLEQGARFVVQCLELMHGGEVFIPRIPSIRIMDLVQALASGCQTRMIGIRPGEKLHEVLISEDEARNTLELEGMFVVQPSHPWWQIENFKEGKHLPEGFSFTSNNNRQWLTVEQLRSLAEDVH